MVDKSTICDPSGPPESLKQPEMHPRSPNFPLSLLKVASMRLSRSKIALNRFCHFHLPSLYPDTLSQQSVTLRAQKQPELHPRSSHFLLSMFKVASIRPYYSWNNIPCYKKYNGKGPCEVLGHLVIKSHLKCL